MSDIVERLRSAIELDIAAGLENRAALETEAADEIETLRRQVAYYVDEMIPKFTSDSLAVQKIHAAEIETLRADNAGLLESIKNQDDLKFAMKGLEKFRQHAKEDQDEIEALRRQVSSYATTLINQKAEIETLRAEVENLRARRHVPFGEIETLRADLDVVSDYLPESHWDSLKITHPEVAKRLSRFT